VEGVSVIKAAIAQAVRRLGQRLRFRPAHSGPEPFVLAVAEDVAELKSAKAEIERLDMLLVDAIDAMQDAVALYDSEDRLLLANPALRHSLAGRADLYVPGRTYEDILRDYYSSTPLGADRMGRRDRGCIRGGHHVAPVGHRLLLAESVDRRAARAPD